MDENNRIQAWDTLLIKDTGELTNVVVLHVYDSGRIKVRRPNGHIIVISPDMVIENHGYVPSGYNRVLRLLTKK